MIIYEHGVFFKLRMGSRSESRSWWLAFAPPTREQYRPCLDGEFAGIALELQLTRLVEEAKVRYTEFLKEIRQVLGLRYKEGETIRFDRVHGKGPIIDGMIGVWWGSKEERFRVIPDLYIRR
jgi:hypothetical protein